MSTKIYNGYRFKTNDLVEINHQIHLWRQKLEPLHKAKVATLMAYISTRFIDAYSLDSPVVELMSKDIGGPQTSPLVLANMMVMDMESKSKKSDRSHPLVDYSFEIVLYPYQNAVYAQVFSSQQDWMRSWNRSSWIQSWGYWNNSDKPSGITVKEWDEREKVWNGIMNQHKSSVPSMIGLVAECTGAIPFLGAKEVLKKVPSFEKRVETWIEEETHRIYKEKDISQPYREWIQTPDGIECRSEQSLRVRQTLQPNITKDILLQLPQNSSEHKIQLSDLSEDTLTLPRM